MQVNRGMVCALLNKAPVASVEPHHIFGFDIATAEDKVMHELRYGQRAHWRTLQE